MSQLAARGGLKNLAAALVEAAQEVASLKWEVKVLKQKRSKK